MRMSTVAVAALGAVSASGGAQVIAFEDVVLNGDLVVIPADPDPPSGTDSDATGLATFVVDEDNQTFSFDLVVDGIFTSEFSGRGNNNTSIQVHRGGPLERRPMIIDVHWYALNEPGGVIVDTADGFMLHAEGDIRSMQGDQNIGLTPEEIIEQIRDVGSFVMVHDQEFPTGAIRGNFIVPAPSSVALLGLGGLIATRRRRSGTTG